MSRSTISFTMLSQLLVLGCALLTLCSSSTLVSALKHGDVTYDMQVLPTHYRPVRVVFRGSNFTTSTRFALSNTSDCGDGGAGGIPDNLTNIAAWTNYDPAGMYISSFNAVGESDVAWACVSYDKGVHWYMAKNLRGRFHFRLWGRVPTSKIAPQRPTVNKLMKVFVKNLPTGSRAALVTDPNGCQGPFPFGGLRGGNMTFMSALDATTSVVYFTPRVAASAVYVCVATPPSLNDWTLAPFDADDEMLFRAWNYDNIPDPHDMVTGRITNMYFRVYDKVNNWRRSYIECDAPFVQGKTTRCHFWLANDTILNIDVNDFAFNALTDGAGVAECPFPTLNTANATHIYFDWMPQRWGREGRLALTYLGGPIKMVESANHAAALLLPNTTLYGEVITDDPISRFMVLPGDTFTVDYASQANMLDILAFTPMAPSFVTTRGIPDAPANSSLLGGEAIYMTLTPATAQAQTSQTVSGIVSASRCKFRARYSFWPDTGVPDQTETTLVARASIISRNAGSVDIEVIKTFYIYVQGQSMIVTGGDLIPLSVTGDIRMTEQLSHEFLWDSDQDGFRVELAIYHQTQRRFYWAEPELKCMPANVGGVTDAGDVTALQNFYNGIGGKKTLLLRWRNAADTQFNGDPCHKKWVGVICRNQRVVELHLDGYGLDGSIPADLGSLTALEAVRLGNNKFVGSLPATLTNLNRLKMLDVQNNNLRSIPATFAASNTNICLKRIFAQRNLIESFPTQTIDSPSVESLRLEWNQISGTMPNYTTPTVPLRELSVAHNKLTGWLPPSLPFQGLIIVDFSDNLFDGPIPTEWAAFKNIQYLDISHNSVSGGVPKELAMIRSASYLTFRAQDNYIGGLVPRLPFESYDLRQNIIACPNPAYESFSNRHNVKALLYDDCDFASLVRFPGTY